MSSQRSYIWPVLTVICGACLLIVALPQSAKQWAPGFLKNPSLHLGLDLAGGTQLDFRISEREIDEQIAQVTQQLQILKNQGGNADELALTQQQLNVLTEQKQNIVESIRTVLERRINAMGVSEAVITPSYIGEEKHLLVECPGVVDVQQCIAQVGKTIKLEFKEEFSEATEEYEAEVRSKASTAFDRLRQGESIETVGEDLSGEIGVIFGSDIAYFQDQLPEGLEEAWDMMPIDPARMIEGSIAVPQRNEAGEIVPQNIAGVFIVKASGEHTSTGRIINEAPVAFTLLAEEDEETEYVSEEEIQTSDESIPLRVLSSLQSMTPGELKVADTEDGTASILFLRKKLAGAEKMSASHILVAYAGAVSAGEDVLRLKDEAKTKAEGIIDQLKNGADFATLAAEQSDGPSGAQGGSLGEFGRGDMVASFEEAAYSLGEGEFTLTPVETQFGFHIIKSDGAPVKEPDTIAYDRLIVSSENAVEKAQSILANLQEGGVKKMEEQARLTTIFFSLVPTGWKDTALDGKHFRSATVTQDPTTRIPIVQISFDAEGARIFQELTKRNINKQVAIFVGGEMVSAPVVQQEISGGTAVITGQRNIEEARRLATDLNTGAIPAPIFLSGQRTVEATLGAEALRESLEAALIGIIILMVYMILFYRVLGLLADIALGAYAIIFFVILKLPLFIFSSNHIVLTLAGMAGIILSIGMAVDANVLIFERVKEELRKGKTLRTAAHTGFERAWPSIRDGNVSTLITCSILFLIGTSIIRGFAITLGMGVLISMFSAIVITRLFIDRISSTPLANRPELFGVGKKKDS